MSVQPAPSGSAPWWAPTSTHSQKRPFPPAVAGRGREGVGLPLAAAVFGGTGLLLAAAVFFLSANAGVMAVLASAALVGAIGGVLFGAWGVRRALGELGVVGLLAGGLALPLGVFDLLVAVSVHLG